MINGYLSNNSPLRGVFPKGVIPLARPGTVFGKCGDAATATEEVYLLAVKQCTDEQRGKMAEMMAAQGQGTLEEARAFMAEATELPIRRVNISGVGIPLRAFI